MAWSHKRALILEYFTVIYNAFEALFSIFFGYLAGSVALVGFGLDSIVESLSGGVMIWRLRKHGRISEEEEERIERKAEMFVGITFIILGLYVLYQSVSKLYLGEHPEGSIPGIVIAILSLITMPTLAYFKIKASKDIKSKALMADAKETLVCALLSVALLIGLSLNYFLGWWWADPVAGLFIVAFLFKEGIEGIRGEEE